MMQEISKNDYGEDAGPSSRGKDRRAFCLGIRERYWSLNVGQNPNVGMETSPQQANEGI